MIDVIDDGHGNPQGSGRKAFDRFDRVDPRCARQCGGSGLVEFVMSGGMY